MGNLINEQKTEGGKSINEMNTGAFKQQDISTPTGDEQNPDNLKKQEKKDRLSSFYTDEEASYYERIMENSKSKNEVLSVRVRDKVESEWGVVEKNTKPFFTQKLATAKKDKKWGSTENDAVKKAKSKFRNADVCTVRELSSMTKYYADLSKTTKVSERAKDSVEDPELLEWVSKLTNDELTPEMFTDDYLSQHMPAMMDIARELQNVSEIREKFPKFYSSLPAEKRAILETREKIGKEMEGLLKDHLYLHGIEIQEKRGETKPSLRREDPVRAIRHRDREELKDNYHTRLYGFLRNALKNSEVDIARTFANSETFSANAEAEEIENEINENVKAKEACGPEMEKSLAEMKKALLLREKMISEQKELIRVFENKELDKEKRREAARKINTNNKRIRLVSRHAEHYREFIDYCLGKRERVTKRTLNFLLKEGNEDFGDLIAFRDSVDVLEEGLILNEKLKIKRALIEKQKEARKRGVETREAEGFVVADYKEGEAAITQEIRELQQKLKDVPVYKKKSAEEIHDLIIKSKFNEARKKREHINALNEKAEKNLSDAMKGSEVLAKKYQLEKNTDRTKDYFFDPFNTFKNLDYTILICRFHPGEDMPYEVREELREKGLKPLLKELLSITPEKLSSMRFSEKTDINSPEYWHNKVLLHIGMDMKDFLDKLKNWNVTLTDDEYAQLKAFGAVAQNIFAEIEENELQQKEPLTVILKGDTPFEKIEDANTNVFKRDGEGSGDIDALANKYSEKSLGYVKKAMKQRGGRGQDEATIFQQLSIMIDRIFSGKMSGDLVGNDIPGDYRNEVQKIKNGMNKSLQDETKMAKIFNDDFGEKEGRVRLKIKKDAENYDAMFSGEQAARWKTRFGTKVHGADLRCFRILMRPVKKDANGTYSEEALRNKQLNDKDFEAFMSGDEMGINSVLYRVGKKIAQIKITPEMFSKDYLHEHFLEVYDDIQLLFGFENFYVEYPDFFESDAFTEEERDAFRRNYSNNEMVSLFVTYFNTYINTYGIERNGKEIKSHKELKTDEEKKEYFRDHIRKVMEQNEFFLAGLPDCQKELQKYEDKFKEKPDEVRRASALYMDRKGKYKRIKSKLEFLKDDINNIPEGSKKKQMLEKIPELKAKLALEVEEAKKELDIATRIRDHVLGNSDGKLSDEDQRYFEENGKATFLHREYDKKAVEEERALEEKSAKKKADDLLNAELSKKETAAEETKVEKTEEKTESVKTEKTEKTEEKKESVKQEKQEEKQEEELPALPDYKVSVNLTINDYEQQEIHNCWCVAGATLFNAFMGVKKGEAGSVSQNDMRKFSPKDNELKSYEEVEKMGLGITKADYDFFVKDRREYMGEGKQEVGSIYETADFFLRKTRDMAVRRLAINLPSLKKQMGTVEKTEDEKKEDRILFNKQKKLFLDEVNAILSTGNPVAILNGHDAHFKTITKIDGEKITLLESSGLKEEVKTIDEVLSRHDNGNLIEITWLSKLRTPEEEMAEQPNLKYSEEDGYSLKQSTEENARNPMWVEGISASNEDKELSVIRSAYLPLKESPLKIKEPDQPANEIHEEKPANEIREEKPVNEIKEEKAESEIREEQKVNEIHNEESSKEEKKNTGEEKKNNNIPESGDWGDALDEMSDLEHDLEFETEIEGLEEFKTIGGMEDAKLVQTIERDRMLNEYEIDDGSVNIETKEELMERLEKESQEEVRERINEPGIKVSETFYKEAAKAKGMKGSFSKSFKAAAADFINSIENFGMGDPDDADFYKAMGLKSVVELIYIGNQPLNDYVKENYNYKGDDPEVLKNYAALIAGKMEAPLILLFPKVVKGELKYIPKHLPVDIVTEDKSILRHKQDYKKSCIRSEQNLRGSIPLHTAVKASRAYREMYNADTYGFAGIESISDRLKTVKKGSDPQFRQFIDNFNTYYMVVERFAYKGVDGAGIGRINEYLSQAYENAVLYMRGKKPKEERHRIALDAIKELEMHKKMLDHALTGGLLRDSWDKASFSQIFEAYRSSVRKKEK